MATKKVRYLLNDKRGDHFVRAWKEGRREIAVQVWLNKSAPEGDPDGDWAMPAVLGPSLCIDQAVAQTRKD